MSRGTTAPAKGVEDNADLVLFNGRIATDDPKQAFASAQATRGSSIQAIGTDAEIMARKGAQTRFVEGVKV